MPSLSYGIQLVALTLAALTFNLSLVVLVALAITVHTDAQPIENRLVARFTPQHLRTTVSSLKFIVTFGLSALGVSLVALIYGLSGSFTGAFLAVAACCIVAIAAELALPRRVPALLPAAAEPAGSSDR